MSNWIQRPTHRAWLDEQARDLLRFHRSTLGGGGRFVELDDDGGPLQGDGSPGLVPAQQLLTVARTVHCYALGELLGIPGCHPVVVRGLETLWDDHRDAGAGGYFAAVGAARPPPPTKAAYTHAFVLLAASSALEAGHDGARTLLNDVLGVVDERFWVDGDGASREDFDRDWHPLEAYRGANANMHLCEAFLAAADATGRWELADRALRIARRLIDGQARAQGWLLPEHYDEDWSPLFEYNRDRPDDPFRPYGATIGHSLEWSRLVLTAARAVAAAPTHTGPSPGTGSGPGSGPGSGSTAWAVAAAEALFGRAVELGWDARHGGLVYTVGWDGLPVNDDHYWWPIAEGITAAAALTEVTGRSGYETWYRRFWDFASTVLIDHRRGGWYPQFDAANRPKIRPWYGKPDLYHALQACLLPVLPLAPSVAGGVRRAMADASRSER
jgi:sulfoquinovose isomerase